MAISRIDHISSVKLKIEYQISYSDLETGDKNVSSETEYAAVATLEPAGDAENSWKIVHTEQKTYFVAFKQPTIITGQKPQ